MMLRRVVIIGFFISVGFACKTVPREPYEPEEPAPAVAPEAVETTAPIEPSPRLQEAPNLVTPGPDEVLNLRGPNARCPTTVELDMLQEVVNSLGRDTVDLVEEDLANLRKTSTRTDRDGINSCCNQLEQLVQDAEIMNEDKADAVPALDKIRSTTRMLCQPD